jgi:peptidoglycan/LPS O-acetylase OafA/YrhL
MDCLRGVAAVGVVFGHLFRNFFPEFHNPGPDDPVSAIFASSPLNAFYNGQFSVTIFFILSGFVLSASVSHSRSSLVSIVVRRYLRLTLPIMAITFIFLVMARSGLFFNDRVGLTAPDAGAMFPPGYTPTFLDWLGKGLFGIYLTGSYPLDAAVWTMKVEIWGSLLVYLVWRLCRQKAVRMAACVLIFVVLAVTVKEDSSFKGIYMFPIGVLIYDLSHGDRLKLLGSHWPLKVGIPALVLAILCAAWRIKHPVLPGIHLFIESLLEPVFGNINRYQSQEFGAILLVTTLSLTVRLHQPLSNGLARYLGAISFPLYLVHLALIAGPGCLLFAWSYDHFGLEAARWIAIPATFVLAMAAATVLTPLVEKPSLALAKRGGEWVEQRMRAAARPILGRQPAG